MDMIQNMIKLSVARERQEEVLKLLRPLVEPTQNLAGCNECSLFVNVKDADQICFSTEWSNRHDIEQYIRSDAFHAILTAMDLCKQQPEVHFCENCQTQGMEYIATVLGINTPLEITSLAFG